MSYTNGDTAVYDPQLLAISQQQLDTSTSATVDDLFSIEQPLPKADAHDEEEPPKDEEAMADDLFGDVEDLDNPPSVTSKEPSPEADSQGGDEPTGLRAIILKQQKALEYGEEDAPEEAVVELKHATLSIPNLPAPRSSDGKHWVLRLPNFIKLDTKPFHPDTYLGPEQNDEFMRQQQGQSNREKSMSIKLEVENTIRWRWEKDEFGQNRRQSNSRIIRWSDGSLSLLLGKELFDINQAVDTAASAPRNFMGAGSGSQSQSQSQTQPSQPSPSNINERTQGLTYLVAQHKRSGILQAEAPITGYMTLRPTGMQSETHRMLVRAVGQKHNKVARLRMTADPVQDPEREKMEMIKMEAKKGRRPRGEDDGFGSPRKRRAAGGAGAGGSRRSRRTYDSVWSDDDDDDAELGTASGASEEDDEHDFDGGGASGDRRKAKHHGASNTKGEYQADGFVVEDSTGDEAMDDSDGGKSRRKRRSGDKGPEEVVDALDEMDAKIAQQEEERKKGRGAKGTKERLGDDDDGTDADAMDVESEEEQEQTTQQDDEDEEEEFQVRKSGAGARRKRAIAIDEEDEEE